MFGYKKAQNNYIVKLEILGMTNEDRKSIKDKLHAKYRTSKARIISITHALDESQEIDSINGLYDKNFTYTKGETIEIKDYCDNKEEICSTGIHYFKTRQQAVYWDLDTSNYTGEVIDYHDNGEVASKCFYKDGKLKGEYITYWFNGEVTSKCFYKDGKREGESIRYWANGEVGSKSFYKDGKLEDEYISYWRNGEVMEKCFYKDGKREGEFIRYHGNGEVVSKCFYKNGKLVNFLN